MIGKTTKLRERVKSNLRQNQNKRHSVPHEIITFALCYFHKQRTQAALYPEPINQARKA